MNDLQNYDFLIVLAFWVGVFGALVATLWFIQTVGMGLHRLIFPKPRNRYTGAAAVAINVVFEGPSGKGPADDAAMTALLKPLQGRVALAAEMLEPEDSRGAGGLTLVTPETYLPVLGGPGRLGLTNTLAAVPGEPLRHPEAYSGGLLRRQCFVRQTGEEARVALRGVSLLRGKQHADTTLVLDHAVPRGESRELFKHIVTGEATGVFQGKVVVRHGAQKTDGGMKSQALLLSDDAAMYNKPELEIFADDVQCGHRRADVRGHFGNLRRSRSHDAGHQRRPRDACLLELGAHL